LHVPFTKGGIEKLADRYAKWALYRSGLPDRSSKWCHYHGKIRYEALLFRKTQQRTNAVASESDTLYTRQQD
jgi:hypothetical protein